MKLKATLRLENGMEFHGWSFGCDKPCSGEVVFNTSMVGYPEQLTDATYNGQILCLTYPLIGNYGVPSEATVNGISTNFESEKIQPKGLVAFDVCEDYSNWEAEKGLEEWMKEQGLTGIYGIDTRELTKILRENGSMKGCIIPENASSEATNEAMHASAVSNPVAEVSCKEVIVYPAQPAQEVFNPNGSKAAVSNGKKVVLVDCGVKHSILRNLMSRGVEVIRVPYDYDFTDMEYDGLYISNGPGTPVSCAKTIEHVRKALDSDKPVFGINLGYLILAEAAGCATEQLKRPHRSANQPVRRSGSNRAYITAQNAAYTVSPDTVPSDWEVSFTNLNDGAIDGIRHRSKPFAGTQFDPQVCVGLTESVTPMDEFISRL